MTMECDNKGNHFFIEIVPDITDKGVYTDKFQLIINVRKTNIDKESFSKLEQICQMGCAALSLMQEDADFKEIVYEYMESPYEPDNINTPKKAKVDSVSGNVITLDFNKDTTH